MNINTQPDSNTQPGVVLIGAAGMLGRAWAELLRDQGVDFVALSHDDIDITNAPSVVAALPEGTQVVINCAAYTNVDGAESARSAAFALNAKGSRHLATRCANINATLVHYSTDYVFDGSASSPYPVDHPIKPVNVYGESKAAGEAAIRETGCKHLIIRTSWLYAPWGNNFVLTMLKFTSEKPQLKVVNDQLGRPTSAQALAAASWRLVQSGETGTFHLTDGGQCTWFEFTQEIARQAGHDCDVQPCTSDAFPRPAKRPHYSVLDLAKSEAILGPLRDWKQNLADVLAQTGKEKSE